MKSEFYKIKIDGKDMNVKRDEYLYLLRRRIEDYYLEIEYYRDLHQFGFPDLNGYYKKENDINDGYDQSLFVNISEKTILHKRNKLKSCSKKIANIDNQMITWLYDSLNVDEKSDSDSRSKLKKRMDNVSWDKKNKKPLGPIWAQNAEYQKFIIESEKIFITASRDYKELTQLIEKIIENGSI